MKRTYSILAEKSIDAFFMQEDDALLDTESDDIASIDSE